MFSPPGIHHVQLKESTGKTSIARRGVDWGGDVIKDMVVTDSGRFFVNYNDRAPGAVVEVFPTLGNRNINVHGGKVRCTALIYRTFVKYAPSLPVTSYKFNSKNGNGLDLCVENIVITTQGVKKCKTNT